jgi:hypothetical protein
MSEESAIILAYAFVVFMPFLVAALVFLDYIKTTNHVYKRRSGGTD